MAVAKNPTQWLNPNRQGYVTNLGNNFLVTNASVFLVDNSGNFLVTNTNFITPNNATAWIQAPAN